MIFYLILFVTIQNVLGGEYKYPACCPKIKPMVVDYVKYKGLWEDYYHTENMDLKCATYDYVDNADKTGYEINTKAVDSKGKPVSSVLHMTFQESKDENAKGTYMAAQKCTESSDCVPGVLPEPLNIFTLYTEYTQCTIEYSCSCNDNKRQESAWVQCRNGQPVYEEAKWKKVLADNNIDVPLIKIRDETCAK